jgi:transcriptional regulator with XRE-family HTH domain
MYEIGRCRITDILREIGWDQQQLADYAELDKRTISFYATGRRKKMPLVIAHTITEAILRYADVKYSPSDLYEFRYAPKPRKKEK